MISSHVDFRTWSCYVARGDLELITITQAFYMSGLKTTPGMDYFISSLSFNFYLKLLGHLYIHGGILQVFID